MLKILFGHDHLFKRDEASAVYSRGGLPYTVLSRYLNYFDALTVLARDGGQSDLNGDAGTLASGVGVEFELIGSISNFKSLISVGASLRMKVRSLVSNHDGVIARLPSEIGLLLVNEAKRQNKPYAVEVVGCPFDAYANHGSVKARLYAPFAAHKVRRAVRTAPYVTYVTNSFLQARYPCIGGVSSAFSDVNISVVDKSIFEERLKRLRNSENKLVVGVIGNYTAKYKGIDVAIRSLALCKDRLPQFEFRVLGSGDSTELKGLAATLGLGEQVFFDPSRAAGLAVNQWLDDLDLYIQPSLTEGLPRALIEAKSRGCPALGSRAGGISELLPADKLTVPGSAEDLARLLVDLMNDRGALEVSAKRNLLESADFSADKLAERREEFWIGFRNYCLSKKC